MEPTGLTRAPRRRRFVLPPGVAALAVGIMLALPLVTRFTVAGRPDLAALPNTGTAPSPAASATSAAPTESVPTASATPMPTPTENATEAVVPAQPAPTAEAPPTQAAPPDGAPGLAVGDPAAAIARFYQDVSGHDFAAAAALWSSRMQARYPPAVYIDHRFAVTQQIKLQAARIIGNRGGQAIVYVQVVEVLDGQTRLWLGTWELVNSESGWLLDRPNLRSES
jgi:hypothetical protein